MDSLLDCAATPRERGAWQDRGQPPPDVRPVSPPVEGREGLDAERTGPADGPAPPQPAVPPLRREPRGSGLNVRRELSSRAALRRALLLAEVLGPPAAMRPPGAPFEQR
ncbi:MAG: hypothetical protein M3Q65_16490 [Chloroflexota bacterium]|nr:hypothetical protein [Chloroflexota bacterium]